METSIVRIVRTRSTLTRRNGEPAYSKNGLKTHGSGYEWEAAFREAFKDDPNIQRILFDCEAGGFFCYANDLTLLEDFRKPV